jgi:Protein of unknown function, DUF488
MHLALAKMTERQQHELSVLTIGHANHTWEHFLELLQKGKVEVVAEVRSYPYSNYSPQFDREAMKDALGQAGVKYVDSGKELGGRPDGLEFYDADGHVLYDKVAATNQFAEGIRRIEEGMTKFRVAMLCSEEDPAVCHRALLVGRVLRDRGARVEHIRGDGRVQANDEVFAKNDRKEKQGKLFEADEAPAWKSIPSVLRIKEDDPLLRRAASGKELWADEPADEYVNRLRDS